MPVIELDAVFWGLGGRKLLDRGEVKAVYWAGGGAYTTVVGKDVVTPSRVVVPIVGGEATAELSLLPTDGSCCVRWTVEHNGTREFGPIFTTIPDVESVVFGDLPRVDPATFAPVDMTPTIQDVLTEAQGAVTVATSAAGEATDASAVAVAAAASVIPSTDAALVAVLGDPTSQAAIQQKATIAGVAYSQSAANQLFAQKVDAIHATLPYPTRPATSVLKTFDTGHAWVKGGTFSATNLNDTTDQGLANQVLSATTDGVGGAGGGYFGGLVPSFDPAGKWIFLRVKVSDPAKLSYIQVRLSQDTTTGANYNNLILIPANSGKTIFPDTWVDLWVPTAGSNATGTGMGAAVQSMRVTFMDTASGAITVKLGGVGYGVPLPGYSAGIASISYDDTGTAPLATRAAMNKYRFRGTVFPINESFGRPNKLTLAQVRDLQNVDRWEVACHANTQAEHNLGFENLTAEQLDMAFTTMRQFANQNGFRGETLALPGGGYNLAAYEIAQKYFNCVRGTVSMRDMIPPANPLWLGSFLLRDTYTLAAAKAHVDGAVASGAWINFVVHSIDDPSATYNWTLANFTELVDYIAAKGMTVLPIGEAVLRMT